MPRVAWMHFNPLGPTTSSLFYVPVPGADEGLLTFRSDNPFDRHHAAFGVMPHDVAAEQIGQVAFMLFAANGHESCPLFGTLPTSIAYEGNWRENVMAPMFDGKLTRTLFKGAAHAVWPSDMRATCEYLRRYNIKEIRWKRTAAEFDGGLLSVLIRQDGEEDAGINEEQFNEWFELVTDAEHLQSERSNFSTAWQVNFDYRCGALAPKFPSKGNVVVEGKFSEDSRQMPVIKIHGSVNWLYCDNCRQLYWFPADDAVRVAMR